MLNKIGLEITLRNASIVSSAYSFNIKAFQEYGINIFFAYCIWGYGNNIPTLSYISLPYYFGEYVPVQAVADMFTCQIVVLRRRLSMSGYFQHCTNSMEYATNFPKL